MYNNYLEEENKCINCSVSGCNYNSGKGKCTLNSINISSTTSNANCSASEDTVCNSFCPKINYDYEYSYELLEDLVD